MLEYISVAKNYVSPIVCTAIKGSVHCDDYREHVTIKETETGEFITHFDRDSRFVLSGSNFKPLFGEMINSIIQSIVEVHIEPKYQCAVQSWESPQILQYPIGGHYKTHADGEHYENGEWRRIIDRDLTLLIYLDSDFEGGEVLFPDYNMTVKPEAGMIITFPSNASFQHSALPLIRGERFVLVTWLTVFGSLRVETTHPERIMRNQYPAILIENSNDNK